MEWNELKEIWSCEERKKGNIEHVLFFQSVRANISRGLFDKVKCECAFEVSI